LSTLLAVLEIVDEEATISNVSSLVIGLALLVWGLANARRSDRRGP